MANCKELNTDDYIDILWTTLAEFPGILLTIAIIEKFGRKKTMAVQHLVFSACVFLILISNQKYVNFFQDKNSKLFFSDDQC